MQSDRAAEIALTLVGSGDDDLSKSTMRANIQFGNFLKDGLEFIEEDSMVCTNDASSDGSFVDLRKTMPAPKFGGI